jgi:hypothetical protein
MNNDTASQNAGANRMQVKFDLLADEYHMQYREKGHLLSASSSGLSQAA